MTEATSEWNVIDRLPTIPNVEIEVFTLKQHDVRRIKFIPDAGAFFYQDCTHPAQNALFTDDGQVIGWRVKP